MCDKISSNKTVILVSHSVEAMRELCDRVLWLDKGKSIACGEPNRVINAYSSAVRDAVKRVMLEARRKAGAAR